MGLFRKKEVAEPEPEVVKMPPEDGSWRVWASWAETAVSENEFPRAITYWVGAVDRFDDKPKFFEKFREDMLSIITREVSTQALKGQIIPGQMLAEIDCEIYTKLPELANGTLSEDVFYFVKEELENAVSSEESVMLLLSADYSILGYFRYCSDIRDVVEKCQEVEKLGQYVISLNKEQLKKAAKKGGVRASDAARAAESISKFFTALKETVEAQVAKMDDAQIEALTAYRKEHRVDRMEYLSAALQACINALGKVLPGKQKDEMHAQLDAFVEAFLKTE